MIDFNTGKFLLSVQKSLLFNVTPNIRYIFVEPLSNGILEMLVYSENKLSEDELDNLYAAAGEVCGDFVELTESNVEIVISQSSFDELNKLKHLVYAVSE